MKRAWIAIVASAVALGGLMLISTANAQEIGRGKPPGDKGPIKIVVIPKGTTHMFWKSVERGAKQAGSELGVEIVWKGPLKENDRSQQVQLLQQFTSEGISGIAVAPLDFKALAAPVKAASAKGIPVVIFDSSLDAKAGSDFVSYIATNNEAGGKIGGEHLAKILGDNKKVVLLKYDVGSASTEQREAGATAALKAAKGVEITVDNRFAGATSAEAKTAAMNIIDKVREAGGVFCSNESTTHGMLLALQQAGLAGKVKFVGFDSSPPLIEALKAGEIDGLVVQNPQKMGYLSVTTLVKHIRGEKVETTIDTGATLVTKANLNDPEIKKLIE